MAAATRGLADPVPAEAALGPIAQFIPAIAANIKVNLASGDVTAIKARVVELQEATLEEAIQFLQLKSKEMDPSGQGVNFVISQNPDSPQNQARINLSLRNIPLVTQIAL